MLPTGSGASVPDVAVVSVSVVCPRVFKGRKFRVPRKRDAAKARLEATLKMQGRKMATVGYLRRPGKTNRALNKRGRNTVSITGERRRSAGIKGDWHLTFESSVLASEGPKSWSIGVLRHGVPGSTGN